MKVNYKRLCDETLVRLLFRLILQGYSASGISLGRSLRSGLLEGYTDLTPLPRVSEADAYYMEELYQEALKRPKSRRRHIRIDHRMTRTKYLAYRCLAGLKLWYEWDTKDENPLFFEKKRVDAACALLPIPSLPKGTSREDLNRFVQEARFRYSDILTAQTNRLLAIPR